MLLPLKLEGKGSADVEALPSFLYRLSYAHGFSVGEFVRALQRRAVRDEIITSDCPEAKYFSPREIVLPGKLTDRIRLLLGSYTDQSTEHAYLWIMRKTLGSSNGEICKHVRWCPECFDEMRRLGVACYWKLIWFLNSVDCCPTHRIELISKCNKCAQTQDTFVRRRPISYCQTCGSDLAKQSCASPSAIKPSWQALGLDVVNLISDCAKVSPQDIQENGAWLSIKEILDYLYDEGREAELYGSMSRDEVLALRFKQRPISLLSARRIAYRLGISLFDFLAGYGARVTRSLNGEYFCTLPPGFLEATPKTKRDHKAYLAKAKRFIDTCDVPPAVDAVSAHLKVSKGYLEYRYPTLVTQIVSRRAEYKVRQKLVLRARATSEALNFFLGIDYAPTRFSKREANIVIRNKTGIPKSIVEAAVHLAFSALDVDIELHEKLEESQAFPRLSSGAATS